MNWKTKCALDTLKACVPFHDRLRTLKRRVRGFQRDPHKDRWTIEQGLEQLKNIRSLIDLSAACILEIGSGWQPLIPLLYSMGGAGRVIMTDLTPLMHGSTLRATAESLRENRCLIQEELCLGSPAFDRFLRLEFQEHWLDDLEQCRLTYLAPCDVRRTRLPDASVDAIISRAVLEHIPPETIREIFAEAHRIVRPGGLMCHIIDNSDHWQHNDLHIPRINFLKYSETAFRWTHVNSLDYQNRLRHSEYREMMEAAAFKIHREDQSVDTESLRILESGFPLARRFRRFSKSDLAATTSFYLARRI